MKSNLDLDFYDEKEMELGHLPEEKEIDMTNTTLDIRDQKRHFETRMYNSWEEKRREASRFFGLDDDEPPKTAREAINRIYSGYYTLPVEKADTDGVWGIRWRHPMEKVDMEGFDNALKVLDKAHQTCKDKIMVGSPWIMMEAVNEFEEVTLH